jgi:hypothetical protein
MRSKASVTPAGDHRARSMIRAPASAREPRHQARGPVDPGRAPAPVRGLTSATDLARLMAGERARLFSTDPPYRQLHGNDRPIMTEVLGQGLVPRLPRDRHQGSWDLLGWGLRGPPADRRSRRCGVYVWRPRATAHDKPPPSGHGLLLHQILVWVKPLRHLRPPLLPLATRALRLGWRRGTCPSTGTARGHSLGTDWDGKRITTFHPTSSPRASLRSPEQHTKRGDIVLEPFSDQSQIIAAEAVRRCFAMESRRRSWMGRSGASRKRRARRRP